MKTIVLLPVLFFALYGESEKISSLPYEKAVPGKSAYNGPIQKVDIESERMIQSNGASCGANGEPMHNFETPKEESVSHHKGHE